jgi:hypothetical protein
MKTQPKDTELRDEWKRVDRALIPEKLLGEMSQPECKALTFLTDVMINATVCKLGPGVGRITAPYSENIEIVLDVAVTIERRGSMERSDRHLVTWVRSLETGAQTSICIAATGGVVPAIDDCVSFVLWAENGFIEPPSTLDDATLFVRDPDSYSLIERRGRERILARNIERKADRLRREARKEARMAKSLAYCKAQQGLRLERQRVRKLGWRELMAEHEAVGTPSGPVEEAAHDLRARLLESV